MGRLARCLLKSSFDHISASYFSITQQNLFSRRSTNNPVPIKIGYRRKDDEITLSVGVAHGNQDCTPMGRLARCLLKSSFDHISASYFSITQQNLSSRRGTNNRVPIKIGYRRKDGEITLSVGVAHGNQDCTPMGRLTTYLLNTSRTTNDHLGVRIGRPFGSPPHSSYFEQSYLLSRSSLKQDFLR